MNAAAAETELVAAGQKVQLDFAAAIAFAVLADVDAAVAASASVVVVEARAHAVEHPLLAERPGRMVLKPVFWPEQGSLQLLMEDEQLRLKFQLHSAVAAVSESRLKPEGQQPEL